MDEIRGLLGEEIKDEIQEISSLEAGNQKQLKM